MLESRALLAVVAALVEDAIPGNGINQAPASSDPRYVTDVGDTVYFLARDDLNGEELWRINPAGVAEMVDDAIPGGGIRPGALGPELYYLTNVNGTLYFRANDGTNGPELWRINSTGVAEIVDDAIPGGGINPGLARSYPGSLTNVQGVLYFKAYDATNGYELWRINPTGVAEIIEDAIPGGGIRSGPSSSNPANLTNVNGTLYFRANDGTNGDELWRINPEGVAEIVDDGMPGGGIRPGPSGAGLANLTNVNGTLYFRADDGTSGFDLWRINSEGIAEVVKDADREGGVGPELRRHNPSNLTNVNGTVYFRSSDNAYGEELWRINSEGWAEIVDDAIPGGGIRPGAFGSEPKYLTNVNGTLYFLANDGTNGSELWRVSPAGMAEIVDDAIPGNGIRPGSGGIISVTPPIRPYLTNVNGTLYFQANDGTNGFELWRINPAGVAEIVDDATPGDGIRPASDDSFPKYLTNVDGTLYFTANDGTHGEEVWRINPAGVAEIIADTIPGVGIRPGSTGSSPGALSNAHGTLYFRANDGTNGIELWRINPAGVAEIVEDAIPGGGIAPGSFFGSNPTRLTNVHGTLYFRADDGANGEELWRINPAGVAEIVEDAIPGGGIRPGASSPFDRFSTSLIDVNGTLYFRADDGTNGSELWRINPAGVAEMVEDAIPGGGIRPGSNSPFDSSSVVWSNVNGTLYFAANDGTNGSELWRINPAGVAEMVEDAIPGGGINPGSTGAFPRYLTNVHGTLYFTAYDGTNGGELWRINSAGVAEMVEDAIPGGGIRPGSRESDPHFLLDINGTLYFRADDGTNGQEFWRINSAGEAEMVEDAIPGGGIGPGSTGSSIRYPTNVNGALYFYIWNSGYDLWRINSAGVAEMVDFSIPGARIVPSGEEELDLPDLTYVNGTIYFQAYDATNGYELWRINSTGVAEIVEDAIPGGGIDPRGSSFPRSLTNVDGTLYFLAYEETNGWNLWRVSPAGLAEMVEDAIPGGGISSDSSYSSLPKNLTNFNGTLYFQNNDGTNGHELWRISPTGIAVIVEDAIPGGGIRPGRFDSVSSYGLNLTSVNGKLYFVANDGTSGPELWRIDEVGNSEPFSAYSLEASPSGVEIAFQWGDVDAARLNLYSGQGQGDVAPDVTLVGRTTGPVTFSAVWDSAAHRLRLIRTGGPLPPDDYTLRLKSGPYGMLSTTGKRLESNWDGLADDNYVFRFTMAPATEPTLSLPDFSRGPGQPVQLADPQGVAADGIPLSIDNAEGVQSVRFDLHYDPRLLAIDRTNSHVGPELEGWTFSLVEDVPGKLTGRLSGTTPLPAGFRTLLVLKAQVPIAAPRNAAHVLRLTTLQLNANGTARGDDALHIATPFGDASGNGVYSGLDASLVARIGVRLDTGFKAMHTIDPAIVGDVTGNGTISGLDASFIARKAVGLNQPQIPDLPAGPRPAALPAPAPLALVDAAILSAFSKPTATSAEPFALERRIPELSLSIRTQARDTFFAALAFEPASNTSGRWIANKCADEIASDPTELHFMPLRVEVGDGLAGASGK